MKNLYFEVKGSQIECVKRKITDEEPMEKSDTRAWFHFSKEWDDSIKVAKFTRGDLEFKPQMIDSENSCYISEDAVKSGWFRLKVIGSPVADMAIYLETENIIVYI